MSSLAAELIWGIEDWRNLSARLERDLFAADQKVVLPMEAAVVDTLNRKPAASGRTAPDA